MPCARLQGFSPKPIRGRLYLPPCICYSAKWEIGGRRMPRQSGQVRKEAALTSPVRVACPVSHPAFATRIKWRSRSVRALMSDDNHPDGNNSKLGVEITEDAPGFDARALNYKTPNVDTPTTALAEHGVHCDEIMQGAHVDVIEMDAASRTGIDDIREIIQNVRYMPAAARYKVYIIDEVHMLSKGAFNGLLKTLEEPPAHVKFIFATTEIRQVPVTVLSRCQRFDLRRLTHDDTITLLNKVCADEGMSLPDDALSLLARAGDGSARDALSLLDRTLVYADMDGSGTMTADTMRTLLGMADRGRIFDLFDTLMGGKVADALAEFDAQYALGADPVVILADLAELIHWLTRLKFVATAAEDVTFSEEMRKRGQHAAERLSARILARSWQTLLAGHDEAQRATNTKAAAEMVLIRLAHLADSPTPEELIKQWEVAPASEAPSNNAASSTQAPKGGATQMSSFASAQAAPQNAPQAETDPTPVLQDFGAIIALADQHRDIALKNALKTAVHLVRFEPAYGERAGRLEIRLAEGYDTLAQELTRKLRQWTGQNWMVSLSQEAGAPTPAETRQSTDDKRHQAALEDPFVAAALAGFPDAEIVSIRDASENFDDDAVEGEQDD